MESGSQNGSISVLVADDHEMVLEMIEMFLSQASEFEVKTARTLDEALEAIAENGPFDVVLLDLVMPGMNGVTGIHKAIEANDGKPVAIITGNPSNRHVMDIVEAGVAGIILKTTHMRTLANALRFIAAGEQYIPRELTIDRELAEKSENNPLSPKEMQVLSYLVEGMANKDIGEAMRLAEPTVKMHVRSICTKLGAKNRTQAVLRSKDLGIA
ncbi:response regulator transcription factor [Roseovarius amoyensis]|uniref:response regulator transcription factor n=1 Tax=Roseovarius amoyensis TaxID=2211448 RepID=UPI000DBE4597|nr:response regulator transcription factor [Roseovarius amoyensis]